MRIWFVEPTVYHNNFGFMAEGSVDEILRIDQIARREFTTSFVDDPEYDEKKSCGAFHQGSSAEWTYWEFWAEMTPEFRQKVLDKIKAIQEEMNSGE